MIGAFLNEAWRASSRAVGAARARLRLRAGDRLMAQERVGDAIREYREAVAAAPWSGAARNDLGVALMAAGDSRAAESEFLRATQATPACAEAHLNLAQFYLAASRPGDAQTQLREAAIHAAGNPRLPHLQGLRALAFGDADAAVACYREAWMADKTDPDVTSGYMMSLSYSDAVTPAALLAAHREWARQLPVPQQGSGSNSGARVSHVPKVSHAPPWRIGYLSPDFRDHAVRYFFEPLIRYHDRARFQVWCYSDVRKADAYTQEIRARAEGWRDCVGVGDSELAAMIRSDRIDILVDLAGHTSGNRLALLAERQAPVQIAALGYPPTTGLLAIDYKLTDAVADPPGADVHYAEKLLRLPDTFWCFAPPADAPPAALSPATANGFVTFGCMGNLAKVGNGALKAWAVILEGVPRARLLLKCPTLDDGAVRDFTRCRMRDAGIETARVDFEGRSDLAGFLSTYARIDIVLDTFPYNGGTTTCHALWMGVPVVSRAGEILLSRMGASMLTRVGLGDLIARSWDEYAQTAVSLARDLARLARLRDSLRDRVKGGALADAPRYVAALEDAIVAILRKDADS